MFAWVDERFAASRRSFRVIVVILLVALVGLLDHFTGYELSFAIFYLVPVATAGWYLSLRTGMAAAVLSAATWLGMDFTSGHTYSYAFVPWWNAAVRLGFFTITVALLSGIRRRLEAERVLARRDTLTGALNALAFKEDAERLLALAARQNRPISLCYIDLDRFKAVNDTRGHHEGDRLLRSIVSAIRDCVRGYDLVARLGGDEFVILVPFADAREALAIAEKVRERIAAVSADGGWGVTASVGVATFRAAPPTVEEAVRAADDLMYQAKEQGRDAVAVADIPAGDRRRSP